MECRGGAIHFQVLIIIDACLGIEVVACTLSVGCENCRTVTPLATADVADSDMLIDECHNYSI